MRAIVGLSMGGYGGEIECEGLVWGNEEMKVAR